MPKHKTEIHFTTTNQFPEEYGTVGIAVKELEERDDWLVIAVLPYCTEENVMGELGKLRSHYDTWYKEKRYFLFIPDTENKIKVSNLNFTMFNFHILNRYGFFDDLKGQPLDWVVDAKKNKISSLYDILIKQTTTAKDLGLV